jgi:uncharacterized protein (TIGR02452 family)
MKKSKRKVIARDTLEILEKGFYYNQTGEKVLLSKVQKEAENKTILYTPERLLQLIKNDPPAKENFKTKFVVDSLSTLDSVRNQFQCDKDLVCLNFASARNPGGGFLKGSQAQEESIARATGLYKCQLKAEGYYKSNRSIKSCLYTDYIIYSPKVPILKNEEGELLDALVYSGIITAPAVNTGVILRNESQNIDEIEPIMKRRIEMVLSICKDQGHKTLILGAWGCGVFGNDPKVIARLFKELLVNKYENQFKKVVFSIYSKDENFINPFIQSFN